MREAETGKSGSGEKLWWKCGVCGHIVREEVPPDPCPACGSKCRFTDVTCYTPDCGGPQNFDPKLV